MGCVSSKILKKDLREEEELVFGNGDCANHVVSLTSSTYGVLKLDKEQEKKPIVMESKKRSPPREEPEVINAWELMEGLEDEVVLKKSPKSGVFLRGLGDLDTRRSPLKFLNLMASPKKLKRFGGKENRGIVNRWDYSPKGGVKSGNFPENSMKESLNLRVLMKGSVKSEAKSEFSRVDSGFLSRRRSLSPLFDPELVASFEKELSEEEEQIKKMVSETPISRMEKKSHESDSIPGPFDQKSLPGGENSVIIYTTTLRGIRKTFEDCNVVRSIIESHLVRMIERDVSMDSGFREELRGIIGKKEVKVPVVFVKGRLIGGADEVVKLEEEGKLGILFDGIPRAEATTACIGCGGVRFVMCVECSGSCKVLEESGKKTVRCGKCNENGLIHCPICS